MFSDYKAIFTNLRNMQDELWKESVARFPGTPVPTDLSDWQQNTLDNVNKLVGHSVRQALELQRYWLDQWAERADGKKLKPRHFSELSADAVDSTQRWLDNQSRMWDQWLAVVRSSGTLGTIGFEEWEGAVQESIKGQMKLLGDWTKLSDIEKLSARELSKLSRQMEKTMQKSIETQRRLWSLWFDELGVANGPSPAEAKDKAAEGITKKKRPRKAAGAGKGSRESSGPEDDLKQITGIGPGLETKLKDAGIRTLQQIAALGEEDIADLESRVAELRGRIRRDQWPEQASRLIS